MMKMDEFSVLIFHESVEGFGYIVDLLSELNPFEAGLICSAKIYKIGVEENEYGFVRLLISNECEVVNLY